jgi:CTP synthase (UTP-ammonia lyase)
MTSQCLRLALVGDYNQGFIPHVRMHDALDHVRDQITWDLAADWIPSTELASGAEVRLSGYNGVWVAPGSPYRSMDGALNTIAFARKTNLPLLGTCGGCQYVMLEFARNVLGIVDGQHAEHNPYASKLIVTPLSCSLVGQRMEVLLEPDSAVANYYGARSAVEEYYCNFGLNPEYENLIHDGGLRIVGKDSQGEPRVLTLPEHPYFVATLFVPQLTSSRKRPHPLVSAFVRAASTNAMLRMGKPASQSPQAAT